MKKISLFAFLCFTICITKAQIATDSGALRTQVNTWIVPNGNITATKLNTVLQGVIGLLTPGGTPSEWRELTDGSGRITNVNDSGIQVRNNNYQPSIIVYGNALHQPDLFDLIDTFQGNAIYAILFNGEQQIHKDVNGTNFINYNEFTDGSYGRAVMSTSGGPLDAQSQDNTGAFILRYNDGTTQDCEFDADGHNGYYFGIHDFAGVSYQALHIEPGGLFEFNGDVNGSSVPTVFSNANGSKHNLSYNDLNGAQVGDEYQGANDGLWYIATSNHDSTSNMTRILVTGGLNATDTANIDFQGSHIFFDPAIVYNALPGFKYLVMDSITGELEQVSSNWALSNDTLYNTNPGVVSIGNINGSGIIIDPNTYVDSIMGVPYIAESEIEFPTGTAYMLLLNDYYTDSALSVQGPNYAKISFKPSKFSYASDLIGSLNTDGIATHIFNLPNVLGTSIIPIKVDNSVAGSDGIVHLSFTGDVNLTAGSTVLTLATVNSNVGTFGSATQVPIVTYNAKGLATAVSNTTIQLAKSQVTGAIAGHTNFTPTTGTTVTLVAKNNNIINPAGTLASLTVALPGSPANDDVIIIRFTQNISSLSISGGTWVNALTSASAGQEVLLTYDSATTSWY